jgi:signal transduction histidine kinase
VTVDVGELMTDVVDDYRRRFPDVQFTVDADPARAAVTDQKLLATGLGHLVENAAGYNDAAEPVVDVDVSSEGEGVTVRVSDNGPGIPAAERAVVTEGRETQLTHGSGLGLWLVAWTVDACDGDLRFAENEPRGSVVVVDLPAAEA